MKKSSHSLLFRVYPKPGTIRVYIDLSELQNHTIDDAVLAGLENGFSPYLQFLTTPTGIYYYLLLCEEIFSEPEPTEEYFQKWEALIEALPGDIRAVRMQIGSALAVAA